MDEDDKKKILSPKIDKKNKIFKGNQKLYDYIPEIVKKINDKEEFKEEFFIKVANELGPTVCVKEITKLLTAVIEGIKWSKENRKKENTKKNIFVNLWTKIWSK